MIAREQAARGIGRKLLILDTWSDRERRGLYRSLGWQEVGTVPGYAWKRRDAGGHDLLLEAVG
jgi:hypothetical protein